MRKKFRYFNLLSVHCSLSDSHYLGQLLEMRLLLHTLPWLQKLRVMYLQQRCVVESWAAYLPLMPSHRRNKISLRVVCVFVWKNLLFRQDPGRAMNVWNFLLSILVRIKDKNIFKYINGQLEKLISKFRCLKSLKLMRDIGLGLAFKLTQVHCKISLHIFYFYKTLL
jgi:hypothetical protein